MQPLLQLADDIGEVRDRALVRLQYIHALDAIPQLPFFLEVEAIPLPVAFDQHAKERKQELQVLFCGRQRERVDREIASLLTDV